MEQIKPGCLRIKSFSSKYHHCWHNSQFLLSLLVLPQQPPRKSQLVTWPGHTNTWACLMAASKKELEGLSLTCLSISEVFTWLSLAVNVSFSLFIHLLSLSQTGGRSGYRQMDRQRDCTSKGNQAEVHLLFQKTKLYFLFHSQATKTSNVSRGEFGKEKVKHTTAFWVFFTKSLFLSVNFQGKVLDFPLHLQKLSSPPKELLVQISASKSCSHCEPSPADL